MRRERKRRLVYGLWALICGVVLLGALRTFWTFRWPRPLAQDQIFLLPRAMGETGLWQFDSHQEGEIARRPWVGNSVSVQGAGDGLLAVGGRRVWQQDGLVLGSFRLPDWTPGTSVLIDQPFFPPTWAPDGEQAQLLLGESGEIAWIEVESGAKRAVKPECDSGQSQLLTPVRRDEAILLCLWELWAVRPESQEPLLTATMGGPARSCLGFAGRPFAVAADTKRQRLWLTGEGGLLCQIDPRTEQIRQVATLPIADAERVELNDLQYAPATDLLYVGIHQWDHDRIDRILVWDLKENKLRSELRLTESFVDFRPSSDGAHLYALIGSPPGLRGPGSTRLVVYDVAAGEVMRELGQVEGFVLDWAVLIE